jgi:hypothetical protein
MEIKQKPIAIFRTKASVLTARDMGNVQIADEVIKDPVFMSAKMNDILGFKAMSGSDFKIISVESIQDPQVFFKLAFGEKED